MKTLHKALLSTSAVAVALLVPDSSTSLASRSDTESMWSNGLQAEYFAAHTATPVRLRHLYTYGDNQDPIGCVSRPDGLAVAPDRTVFVTDSDNLRVQRFDPGGEVLAAWGRLGEGDGLFLPGQYGGPAVGPDGTVYVTDLRRHRIQRFSWSGKYLGSWAGHGEGSGQLAEPADVAAGADGSVYVAERGNKRVQRFASDGRSLGVIGVGQLRAPHRVSIAPDGGLYVIDFVGAERFGGGAPDCAAAPGSEPGADTHRIARFAANGEFLGHWPPSSSVELRLTAWSQVDVSADGSVYVLGGGDSPSNPARVQHLTAAGDLIGGWSVLSSHDSRLDRDFPPSSLAVAQDGTIYVAPTDGWRVRHFDAAGSPLGDLAQPCPSDVGRIADVAALAAGWGEDVYVADSGPGLGVIRFGVDGAFQNRWPRGGAPGDVSEPAALAAAPSGPVLVLDFTEGLVRRFDSSGSLLDEWGAAYLAHPEDVAVAPDGTAYVADTWHVRVVRFTTDGGFLTKWGRCVMVTDPGGSPWCRDGDGEFYVPDDVAVAPDGTVYVSDRAHQRIQYFTPQGEFIGKWGTGASGALAAGPDGTVFFGDREGRFVRAYGRWGGYLGGSRVRSGGYGDPIVPKELAVDDAGRLHVAEGAVRMADVAGRRVHVLSTRPSSAWRARYYANRWLAGAPLAITETQEIDFDWGAAAPLLQLPSDGFSARFERTVPLAVDRYQLAVVAEGGIRLWIDGRLLVDEWNSSWVSEKIETVLGSDDHVLCIEYNDTGGSASVYLEWSGLGGLIRRYLPYCGRG